MDVNGERLVRALLKGGWTVVRRSGSHAVLKSDAGTTLVVPVHKKPLAVGTLAGILKRASLTDDELKKLL
jgi:predicted RNA binding protein YcfA (HicA-like mRNA interferase family)